MHPVINAKVTLYLENVPAYHPISHQLMNKDEIASYIEDVCRDSLANIGIYYCDPSEAIISEPNPNVNVLEHTFDLCGDYYSKNLQDKTKLSEPVYPVGYLCPDGKWYLVTEEDDQLAHINLASTIYEEYKDKGFKFNLMESGYPDEVLEKNGFIKVHGFDIRYYAHFKCWNVAAQKADHTPDVNEIQRKELIRYCELLHNLDKSLYDYDSNEIRINERHIDSRKLKQMDELMLRKTFSFDSWS